jgi:hypothetical protein
MLNSLNLKVSSKVQGSQYLLPHTPTLYICIQYIIYSFRSVAGSTRSQNGTLDKMHTPELLTPPASTLTPFKLPSTQTQHCEA